MLPRILVVFPLLLSLVAFVLSFLALFAGHKDGFMEDYAVARLNTSRLGYNLLQTDGDASTNKDDDKKSGGSGSLWDKAKDKWDDIKDDVKDKVNDITNDAAEELADALGISEWYSLHLMDSCEGQFKPNATAPGAGLNTTNCTDSAPNYRFNLTDILDHQLEVGPFRLNLADLNWPDEIQENLDILNNALLGLFILYVLGIGFSGLAMLGSIAAFFLHQRSSVALTNVITTLLGALSITIASIVATVAAKKGVEKINDIGDDIGLAADVGTKFLIITWVAAGFMIAACSYWTTQLCLMRREKKKRWTSRHHKNEVSG